MNSLMASTEKPPRCPATESSSLLSPSIRNVLLRVSWPAEEMPLPAVLVTPGVSCASVAKLRPAIGSSSISVVVMVVPSAERVVSTSGNSAGHRDGFLQCGHAQGQRKREFLRDGEHQIGAHQPAEARRSAVIS